MTKKTQASSLKPHTVSPQPPRQEIQAGIGQFMATFQAAGVVGRGLLVVAGGGPTLTTTQRNLRRVGNLARIPCTVRACAYVCDTRVKFIQLSYHSYSKQQLKNTHGLTKYELQSLRIWQECDLGVFFLLQPFSNLNSQVVAKKANKRIVKDRPR